MALLERDPEHLAHHRLGLVGPEPADEIAMQHGGVAVEDRSEPHGLVAATRRSITASDSSSTLLIFPAGAREFAPVAPGHLSAVRQWSRRRSRTRQLGSTTR